MGVEGRGLVGQLLHLHGLQPSAPNSVSLDPQLKFEEYNTEEYNFEDYNFEEYTYRPSSVEPALFPHSAHPNTNFKKQRQNYPAACLVRRKAETCPCTTPRFRSKGLGHFKAGQIVHWTQQPRPQNPTPLTQTPNPKLKPMGYFADESSRVAEVCPIWPQV